MEKLNLNSNLNNNQLVEIPEDFLCPITQELMEDPVIAADGHSYERAAITLWLQGHHSSPLTNQRLSHRMITENFTLKKAINAFKKNIPKFQLENQIKVDLNEAIRLKEEEYEYQLLKNKRQRDDYEEILAEEKSKVADLEIGRAHV